MSQKEMEELFKTYGNNNSTPSATHSSTSGSGNMYEAQAIPLSPLPPPTPEPMPTPIIQLQSNAKATLNQEHGSGSFFGNKNGATESETHSHPKVIISNIRYTSLNNETFDSPKSPSPPQKMLESTASFQHQSQNEADLIDDIDKWTIHSNMRDDSQNDNNADFSRVRHFNSSLNHFSELLRKLPWLDIICISVTIIGLLYVILNFDRVTDALFAVLLPILTHLSVILTLLGVGYVIYRMIRRRFR
ncbi:MAG: hypothetical protein K5895_02145 [Lachnospiraceae bacterium]|nr:hypothetical protein [Lachnospiraceae bacterium]